MGTAAGILMDSFPSRMLLIPSLVVRIGRWELLAVDAGAHGGDGGDSRGVDGERAM